MKFMTKRYKTKMCGLFACIPFFMSFLVKKALPDGRAGFSYKSVLGSSNTHYWYVQKTWFRSNSYTK